MVKLSRVLKVEVGRPGEFAKLGSKEAIVKKLEERSVPEARKLFEKFVRDWEKLQAQPEQVAAGLRATALHTREASISGLDLAICQLITVTR